METLQEGKPSTEYLKYADRVRIEMKLANGQPLFGAIDQQIAPLVK